MNKKFFAVFNKGLLVHLSSSSEKAARCFLGTDDPEGTLCDGLFRVDDLEQLSLLIEKQKEL